jgi:RNA 2',3'-cyclic 3'-phosphodiesterase
VAKERLKSPRGRLFVALDLPAEVRERLARWQRGLTDPALRPVRAENLHITLVFLGWQAERDFERVAEAALGTGSASPPPAAPGVELLPEPVGRPAGKRPRLYAIEARSPETEAVQTQVSARLQTARLYRPEKRPFWPHLTVARVRPERRGGRRPAPVRTPPGPLEGTPVRFRPTRLVVFQSHLHPSGARYEPMAELELPTAT